ncbi:MAG TPA: hypothetical protein VF185_00725 [Patescibacteria group bacterium]
MSCNFETGSGGWCDYTAFSFSCSPGQYGSGNCGGSTTTNPGKCWIASSSPTPTPPGGGGGGGCNASNCDPAQSNICCGNGSCVKSYVGCGGGYVPGCAWDTGATGYPRCNYGEGNYCDATCSTYGTCSGCAPGLTNQGGTCLCPPPPTCTISLPPSVQAFVGGETSVTPTLTTTNGSISEIDYNTGNAAIATATSPITSSPFRTAVRGVGIGNTVMSASVVMGGSIRCSAQTAVNVAPSKAWWQVKDGDVITNGNLTSLIPLTCTLPGCIPSFNLDGTGTFPGVVTYGGATADFSAGATNGTVSSKKWLTNTTYQGKTYNYAYFEGLIPSDIQVNDIPTDSISGAYLQANGTPSHGFVWFRRNGDLTLTGNVNVNSSRKYIILVKGGNLTVASSIRVSKVGDGFFMAIAGKDAGGSGGNIIFDPTLTSNPGTPAAEGLFLADGVISTGLGASQLSIRGSLAGLSGINLQRDLGALNTTTPAEFIQYAPDFLFSYPRDLTRTRVIWREIAP